MTDPPANAGGDRKFRVIRGSSWIADTRACRSAYRAFGEPTSRDSRCGFRAD